MKTLKLIVLSMVTIASTAKAEIFIYPDDFDTHAICSKAFWAKGAFSESTSINRESLLFR